MGLDRKVIAGGIGGIVAWGVLAGVSAATTALGHPFDFGAWIQPAIHAVWPLIAGQSPEPSAQGLLAILLGQLLAAWVPPSDWDILKRLDDRLIAIAQQGQGVPNVTPIAGDNTVSTPPATLQ